MSGSTNVHIISIQPEASINLSKQKVVQLPSMKIDLLFGLLIRKLKNY